MPNYIFFDIDEQIDKPIFRVFSIERLLEIFATRKLVLVKPKMWDDPFENFILKSKASFENGEQVNLAFAQSIYGQCWSRHKESDAMWRIYSSNINGVKVRVTSRKIREALASAVVHPEVSAFIGQVQYKYQSELTTMLTDRVRMQQKIFDGSGRGHAESLLFKRKEFSHEKEVRLIYSGTTEDAENDIFSFAIDPYELFEEIIFDPRMGKNLVSVYEEHFRSIRFRGKIGQSSLYQLPKLTVNI